nr:unnamed protein product [Spirometra erinaceieuropaei]
MLMDISDATAANLKTLDEEEEEEEEEEDGSGASGRQSTLFDGVRGKGEVGDNTNFMHLALRIRPIDALGEALCIRYILVVWSHLPRPLLGWIRLNVTDRILVPIASRLVFKSPH